MNGLRMNLTTCRNGAGSSRRRGITILEVLIAAGVLAVGMFGIMAMIPLIAMRLREGEIADRSAIVGRNAIEEVRLRGWTSPSNWTQVLPDGSMSQGVPATPAFADLATIPVPSAICIDPLGVAKLSSTSLAVCRRFPVSVPATLSGSQCFPTMPRVTTTQLASPFGTNELLNQALAEAAVVAEDDLLSERPKSRTELPMQTFPSVASTTSVDQTRRMAQRDFTWFATLQSLNGRTDVPGGVSRISPFVQRTVNDSGNYLLSTVVCVQRDRDYGAMEEVMGSIASGGPSTSPVGRFYSTGVTGGEVEIDATADSRILDITPGSWVMLSVDHPPYDHDSSSTTPFVDPYPHHRWYQVVEAAPSVPTDTLKTVTLFGADWEFWNLKHLGTGAPLATQVTWIPSVVSVSEKTITLGSNSVWDR